MNLKTTRAALLGAFKHVAGIVETKSSIPILANVMLTAADGALAIVATDLEIAVSLRVTCDVSAPGSCTAPAATLYEIARKLPADAEVTLSWKDEKLTLRAGRYLTSLATLPVEDFPAMTAGAFPHTFQIAEIVTNHTFTLLPLPPSMFLLIGRQERLRKASEAHQQIDGLFVRSRVHFA